MYLNVTACVDVYPCIHVYVCIICICTYCRYQHVCVHYMYLNVYVCITCIVCMYVLFILHVFECISQGRVSEYIHIQLNNTSIYKQYMQKHKYIPDTWKAQMYVFVCILKAIHTNTKWNVSIPA